MQRYQCIQYIRERQQTHPVELPEDAAPRLRPIPGIRAFVFDIYGTLFSSGVGDISLAAEGDRDDAIKAALRARGVDIRPAAANIRLDEQLYRIIHQHHAKRRQEGCAFPEVDIRDVWRDLLAHLKDRQLVEYTEPADIETLAIDYETRVNPTQPMPGLSRVLRALKARGAVLGIISNAQFYTPLLFEAHLKATPATMEFCPHCCIWSYHLLEAKPSTRLYSDAAQALMRHHGIAPESALYIGNDLRNDIRPAQAVGFKTALFAGDRRSLRRRTDDPDCQNVQPDLEITHLEQLLLNASESRRVSRSAPIHQAPRPSQP